MAGPAITTLLAPNPASGNLTADGTEQTLASSTAASGVFMPRVNLANMVNGDLVVIRCYMKANGSDTEGLSFSLSFFGVQTDVLPALPAVPTAEDIKFTLQETPISGHHTYQWGILNLLGT